MNKINDALFNLIIVVLFVTVLFTGCAFVKVKYPTIADRDATSWTCLPDKSDPNGIVCIDAAVPVCSDLRNTEGRVEM